MYVPQVNFSVLKGKILKGIEVREDADRGDKIIFVVSRTESYLMEHVQDCCETVVIEDICGDWGHLIGSPILVADERCSEENDRENCQSETWTFYELATIHGSVTIRWHGSSNGYYSEKVAFRRIKGTEENA